MRASMEFELPEDEAELLAAVHGMDHLCAIRDFHEQLCTLKKFGHSYTTADEAVAALHHDFCDMMEAFLK